MQSLSLLNAKPQFQRIKQKDFEELDTMDEMDTCSEEDICEIDTS